MKTIQRAADFDGRGRKVCLAIGVFDGVHVGHQRIIGQTVSDAAVHDAVPVVVTFDRHPNYVVAPDRVPPAIYQPERRAIEIERLGVELLLVIPFDLEFSRQSGETFIRSLARDLGAIHGVCVGRRFTFGQGRRGNLELLEQLGHEIGFHVNGIEPVTWRGEPVSSTRVRDALERGSFADAAEMLGREWVLEGRVARGDGIGRKLGAPTANLAVPGMVLPPFGVYVAQAIFGQTRRRAVVNIGRRPTLQHPTPELRVEAHVLGFDGDLYGLELGLAFERRLREERRFNSLGELQTQIQRDIAMAAASP
jgi:riboflavin kinase/FMN adenylyltransferase